MSKSRNMADLLDSNGDVKSGALDNVPPSNDASALTTGTLPVDRVPYLGRRNLIINGAMQVAQRGTSAIGAAGGRVYTTDRFYLGRYGSSSAGFTGQQVSASGVDNFTTALKITVTTTDTPSSSEANMVGHSFEGYNIDCLGFGTSNAKDITLSFWVKSSIAGTYGVTCSDSGAAAGYAASYTIDSANTWEKKIVTIPKFTGISGATDNWATNSSNSGMFINWGLGSAGARNLTPNSWISTGGLTPTGVIGQVNLVGTSGATFEITGVQLEVGSVATPFEHRSYGEELALCQRYYQVLSYTDGAMIASGIAANSGAARAAIYFNTMRAAPTVTLPTAGQSSGTQTYLNTSTAYPTTTGTHTATAISVRSFRFNGDSYSGLVGSYPAWLYSTGNTEIALSAEL
jgi:hypothetical protein